MKKALALILCVIALLSVFSGCGADKNAKSGKLKIITTIFPIYDWVKEITADNDDVELSMLLDNGVDIHSFQPSAEDIVNISTCDMFIYVGGESDSWVSDALKEKINKDMVVINLLDVLGNSAKDEKVVEGMESDEDEEEPETDEHVWLSLKNAEKFCSYISEKLSSADSGNKKLYEKNSKAYISELKALDKSYKTAVNNSKKKTLVFGDRFPFLYLTEDYGINYYAAFVGCSAETEASFKTIAFLADKVDEYKLNAILKIETSDGSIAKTIKNNTKSKNQKILTMNSLQSITASDIEKNTTYLSEMERNLKTLKDALK